MQLEEYISQPAGIHLDFFWIDSRGNIPQLFPTLCAFLNTEGGKIIIGVSREKEYQQLSKSKIDDFKTTFEERSLRHKGYLNPSFAFHIKEEIIDGYYLLIIDVPRSPILHKSGDRIYTRDGADIIRVDDPQQITNLYLIRRPNTESEIIPYLKRSDLNLELLNKARIIVERRDTSHKWLSMTDDDILRGSKLLVRDFNTGDEGFILAAGLLLGKDKTLTTLLPAYKLDIFVRKDNVDRWDDRKIFITNLIDTRNGALDFIKGHLPELFYQDGDQRKDLRDLIFREIVGNIIIHREYRNALPSEIVIKKDCVKATNPNIVYHKGPLDLHNFSHFPKNPVIRKFFNELGWSEEAGSGVPNVTRFLKIYAKGAVPFFNEDEIFTAEIPLTVYQLGDRTTYILEMLGISSDTFDEKRRVLLKEIPLNPDLDIHENKKEFILAFIGTLGKNEGKLSGFKILRKNVLIKDALDLEGTLHQIGGNLLIKKANLLLKVLIGLVGEMKLEEAMMFGGFESKESFRENYIKILRNNNLITLTIPDNINDPKQKYIITEKGKRLIGGLDI